ncbi:MAG: uracil phosphoribosyltransferase [Cyclobacteriaceae bacterium]|nr:uracil phosphoribosyltransferase [Cyclobacteriaceae bacterium]
MKVRNLGESPTIANRFLALLRDPATQKDRFLFRRNLARLGQIMAYEISKELVYREKEVLTPLGKKRMSLPEDNVVLLTVLRAGVPFLEGFQQVFDQADTGFVGAFRVEGAAELKIQAGYVAVPQLAGKHVILLDTMLATGKSLAEVLRLLEGHGKPAHLYLASVIAAPEGVRYLTETVKQPASLWTFAIDDRLNNEYYILPGLGDAGDLSYGEK